MGVRQTHGNTSEKSLPDRLRHARGPGCGRGYRPGSVRSGLSIFDEIQGAVESGDLVAPDHRESLYQRDPKAQNSKTSFTFGDFGKSSFFPGRTISRVGAEGNSTGNSHGCRLPAPETESHLRYASRRGTQPCRNRQNSESERGSSTRKLFSGTEEAARGAEGS